MNRAIKVKFWDGKEMTGPFTLADMTRYGYDDLANLTPLQFTGLKDKQGNEIFEGDVLQSDVDAERGDMFVVSFGDGGFVLSSGNTNKHQINQGPCDSYNCIIRNIIGNIYENHELLKQ